VVVALVGCGTDGDQTINIQHDACAPLALVSASATEGQRIGMSDGQELWRDRGAPSLGLRADTTLEVRFDTAAAAFHGHYDDETSVIYINNQITDDKVLAIVIAHELGHAFGLPHITDRESVMNPGNLTIVPNAEDQRAIEALWGSCD
jgi:hypothetical protein